MRVRVTHSLSVASRLACGWGRATAAGRAQSPPEHLLVNRAAAISAPTARRPASALAFLHVTSSSTRGSSLPPFTDVSADRVRHLCDGRQAYPAMLEAIAAARSEVLLEMYWVGADPAGSRFRDALVACARRGVVVRVLYDDVGSLGLSGSWWAPLEAVGGTVASYSPIAPWRKRFRWVQIFFRDHRKLLVVDGEVGVAGGINLARPWLPGEEGGLDWRDDAIEVRGPIALDLRRVFASTWERCGKPGLEGSSAPPRIGTLTGPQVEGASRASVLANRIGPRPDRRIRRAYLQAIRRARVSVDIASSYFLPGPIFLHALRAACRRGVRVRILIPKVGDIWLASLAVSHLVGRLLEDGVEVYAYARRMLHSKTAIVDRRLVIIGSHNLDTLSWRYNLECNVAVDDEAFAENVVQTFGRDIEDAERLDLGAWRRRPLRLRLLAWAVARFRMLL